jgi:phenylpropionate dioxygenase-like ring-hydroxylating dioxygenase large terminal subunit
MQMDQLPAGPDLRRIDSDPDFWYPLLRGKRLRKGRTVAVSFAGLPIVLARSRTGAVFALEDRCAHRQVPLSGGVVDGETIKCGYHGWRYDATGACVDVPYLGHCSLPNGVRAYACREAYGLIFVFPGDPARAATVPFPDVPASLDRAYKTRFLDRRIGCHYTFMHENLMDMNHQFLHRRLMGSIKPTLLDSRRGDDFMEATYTFDRTEGRASLGEAFMVGRAETETDTKQDLMVIRTEYPYQRLTFTQAGSALPALDLWLAYVPVDREQRVTHSFGLMNIRRPSVPGLIHLFWPAIVWFTNGIFAQDQAIMEAEQRAHDLQGCDRNNEVFPLIKRLREVLARRGRPAALLELLPGRALPVVPALG